MHQQSARPAPSDATFLQSAKVAAIIQGSPKTISHWATAGLLPFQRTLGSRAESAIRELAATLAWEVPAS